VVTLTIDGKEVQVPEGTNLVDAAASVGIEIPTYCYHPGLSVVGQCRICFVEVEGMPRLVTACSTPVQPNMVVLTDSERVQEARAAVMEFLLENHPLDCPVCDQAGECLLQDYSVEHGLDTTHMVDERRTFPGFERRLIGPHVVQNQNRCIHCTRCIRFTQEIAETADLTMKSRGNHSYIDTYDGQPFDNPWSACAADVCPVGALTVKEFRFRARVWHLEDTDSVCPGCSIGCNIKLGHLDDVVHRFIPRENREVNGWWMCDYGRSLAEGLNERDVDRPVVRTADGERAVTWREMTAMLRSLVAESDATRVVASANLSNEALFLVKQVFADHFGLEVVVPVETGESRKIKNGRNRWVTSRDAHANSSGARHIGLRMVDAAGLVEFAESGSGPFLILDDRAHSWLASDEASAMLGGRRLAVTSRTATPLAKAAELLLPLASWVETEGTYTSSTGRVQLARRGFFPKGQVRPAWQILFELAVAAGVYEARTVSSRSLFDMLAASVAAFKGMTYQRVEAESGILVPEEVLDVVG
jgi:NADH-quinone oxidoreductase subunit G